MKAKWMLALLALAGLLAAAAVMAADAPRKAPAQPAAAIQDGGHGDFDPAHPDFEGDDDDLFATGMRGDHGPGRGHGGPGGPGCGENCGMGHGGGRGMGHMGMGPGGAGGPGHMAGLFAGLDLSDAQREKLRDLHQRQARKGVQARADLELARMDLHELMQADKPDGAAINAQIDKLARLQSEQRKAQVATLLEARSLLTPEQQKQLRERHLRGPGMGPRGPHHPGAPGEGGAKQK